MIEIWQLLLIVSYIWLIYDLKNSHTKPINQRLKDFVNEEVTRMSSREKQMRVRLGLEPVITALSVDDGPLNKDFRAFIERERNNVR